MRPVLLLFALPILTGVAYLYDAFKRKKTEPFNVPVQIWLADLVMIGLGFGAWMALKPLTGEAIDLLYEAARRIILCLCAVLAAQDLLQLLGLKFSLQLKAIVYAVLAALFALSHGLGLLVWWLVWMILGLRQPVSMTGVRIVFVAGWVYGIAYALPFQDWGPSFTGTVLGSSCYISAFEEGWSYLTQAPRKGFSLKNPELCVPLWVANPLFWVACLQAVRGRGFAAGAVSLFAFYFGISSYGVGSFFERFCPAYHVWVGSMLLMAVLCFIFAFREKRAQTSPPASA